MQLRIAARQVDRIRAGVGRLVGERRERQDLGAGVAPALEDRGVGEGEGEVVGDARCAGRAAAAAAPAGRTGRARTAARAAAAGPDRARAATRSAAPSRNALERRQLARLHQAEVPLRQLAARVRRQAAEHRLGEAIVAGAAQQRRRGARSPTRLNTTRRDLDVVAMADEAFDQRGGGGAHAARIDHQDHRQVEQARPGRRSSRGRRRRRRTAP